MNLVFNTEQQLIQKIVTTHHHAQFTRDFVERPITYP
jgi:hypothetical protein